MHRAVGVRKGTEPFGNYEYDSGSELDDTGISHGRIINNCNGYDRHALRVDTNDRMKFPMLVYSNIDTWAQVANSVVQAMNSTKSPQLPTIRHFWMRLLEGSAASAVPWRTFPMTTGQLAKIIPNLIPSPQTQTTTRPQDHWTLFLGQLESLSLCVWGHLNVRRQDGGRPWDYQFGVYDQVPLQTFLKMTTTRLRKLEICIFHDHDPFHNRGISITDITAVIPNSFLNFTTLHIESTFLGDTLVPQSTLYNRWNTLWRHLPDTLSDFTLKRCGFNTVASWENFLILTLTNPGQKKLQHFQLDEVYCVVVPAAGLWNYKTVCWNNNSRQSQNGCNRNHLKTKLDILSSEILSGLRQGTNRSGPITAVDIRQLVTYIHDAGQANFKLNFKEDEIDPGILS
jgi:hypothetical protein